MYEFLLRQKIKRIIKHSARERVYQSMEEINTVMVLLDMKDFEDANFILEQLKKFGKKIQVYACKSPQDINNYPTESVTIVYKKETKGLSGEPVNQIIKKVSKEKFDLVIDLTLEENLLLLYILVSTNSPLKIGLQKHIPRVHDIVISSASGKGQNVKRMGEQLISYLSTMSSIFGFSNP